MSKKILIIDDDADDRDLFVAAVKLVDKNIICYKADGATEAFQTIDRGEMPDFIFLDLNMPEIDGKQFLQKIKNYPSLKNIPIIIYTTSKLKEDEKELIEMGAKVFFTKPSKLEDLKFNIDCVLNEQYEKIKTGVNPFTNSGGLG